ncbi:MAG: HD-GYP domain-containing protein [Planctomycetota bacterium]
MRPVKKRREIDRIKRKRLVLLMLVQVICIGVGLWLHYMTTVAATNAYVIDDAYESLTRVAGTMVRAVHAKVDGGDAAAIVNMLDGADSAEFIPPNGGVAVVGNDGQVIAANYDLKQELSTGVGSDGGALSHPIAQGGRSTTTLREDAARINQVMTPGAAIQWTSLPEPRQRQFERHDTVLGTARVGSHNFFASAYRSSPGGNIVMCFVPEEIALESLATLKLVLPAIGGIAGVWIFALLTTGSFLFTNQERMRPELEEKKKATKTLRQAQSLLRARDAVIFGLAKLADSRDPDTGDHLERICLYSTALASAMQRQQEYAHIVTPNFVRLIGTCSALHDIGKVGIEDSILRKPAPLLTTEREEMQKHTLIGGECLREIEKRLGQSNFLHMAYEIAMTHHERWDGTGYPLGLAGKAIPLSGRIVAIADVYDALSSRRVYKDSYPHDECFKLIKEMAGTHFDPKIVDVWLKMKDEIRDIAMNCGNAEAEAANADQEDPHEIEGTVMSLTQE